MWVQVWQADDGTWSWELTWWDGAIMDGATGYKCEADAMADGNAAMRHYEQR